MRIHLIIVRVLKSTPMSADTSDLLKTRRQFAEDRLRKLAGRVSDINALASLPDLCIYVTGSYGRLEASTHSDIDLFFVHTGSESTTAVPRLVKTRLDARLIDVVEELGFPEFSNDGEYLTIHYLDDIRDALGSPSDDYCNFFTARMLLLLESQAVVNNDVYEQVIKDTIESYYRDYHDHETNFRPIFLINDILRFWKTLCLNYEHRRNRRGTTNEALNKSHLKNLKLKFSRMLTCFSAVLLLARNRSVISPGNLSKIIHLSPLDRLDQAAESISGAEDLVSSLKENYAWFLDMTGKDSAAVLEWIGNRGSRNDAFDRARRFGSDMYGLLVQGAEEADTLRYLVL